MTEPVVQFSGVEDCLAFIRGHASELKTMTVEIDEAEAAYVERQAAIYNCNADEFISAITMLHVQQQILAEQQRRT